MVGRCGIHRFWRQQRVALIPTGRHRTVVCRRSAETVSAIFQATTYRLSRLYSCFRIVYANHCVWDFHGICPWRSGGRRYGRRGSLLVAPNKTWGICYVKTIGRATFFVRLSRFLSKWTAALPLAICLVIAAAFSVIYMDLGGTGGWFRHGVHLSRLQLMAVLVAACCVPLGAREGRARPLIWWRPLGVPSLAVCVAILLLAVGGASRPSPLILGLALGTGLLI